jgi:hypothetical protein
VLPLETLPDQAEIPQDDPERKLTVVLAAQNGRAPMVSREVVVASPHPYERPNGSIDAPGIERDFDAFSGSDY